jgi:hypothetical protein
MMDDLLRDCIGGQVAVPSRMLTTAYFTPMIFLGIRLIPPAALAVHFCIGQVYAAGVLVLGLIANPQIRVSRKNIELNKALSNR